MKTLAQRLLCRTACLSCIPAILATPAFAADFDGSKPLICAPVDAVNLLSGEEIVKSRPSDAGAPSFLRVDFANKKITGPKQVTPIKYMEKSDKQILLQGTELGFGWTLALDQQDGGMTVTFADRTGAVVLSGSCTPV
jgi:hypothetical protein